MPSIADQPQTLAECVDFYEEDCLARGQSPRTVHSKVLYLNHFVAWCAGQKVRKPKQVTLALMESYRRHLAKYRQPIKNIPLDIATIRNRLTAVKTFMSRLHYHGITRADSTTVFELPRVPRRLPKTFLDVDEIELILDQTLLYGVGGLRDRAVLETYYATGIRRMELANLSIWDLDIQNGLLAVNKGKGGKDRRVPIAERACEWISFYLKEIRPKFAHIESGAALFLANDGYAFRESQLTRLASKYVKRSGISKPGACNLFRHSTATLMLERGADIRHIQELLGHADISTTQIYAHVTLEQLKRVYARTHPAALSNKL